MCSEKIFKKDLDRDIGDLVVNKVALSIEKVSPNPGDVLIIKYDGDIYDLEDVKGSLVSLMNDFSRDGIIPLIIDKHYEIELRKGVKPKDGDGYILGLLGLDDGENDE